jgi:hypothetical protein
MPPTSPPGTIAISPRLICRRRDLERFPYLGPGFELTEKTPGSDPTLGQIHLVNFGAHASHAGIASDIRASISRPNGWPGAS